MSLRLRVLASAFCLLFAACSRSTCPPGAVSYLDPPYPTPAPGSGQPQSLRIGRQDILFDGVVSGPLCDQSWAGTIYVSCDLQIPRWKGEGEEEAEPLFLQDCQLEIAPDTVVYVAAHGDQPYYQGCSCHQ